MPQLAAQPTTDPQPGATIEPRPTADASGVHHFDPWRTPWHDAPVNPSFCDYALWRTSPDGFAVLLVSERPDNPGMSVTNAVEFIVAELVERLGLTLDRTTVIEHYYPLPRYQRERTETFDVVTLHPALTTYGGFAEPKWKRIERADVEAMIGGPL